MKTKIDKKAKKRSLNETSLSIKSNQKQKTIIGPKKNPKKAKLVGLVQNGNSTMGNKVQILKKMYKQKEKPKIKQTNTGSLAEIKTEGIKLPIAKLNDESVGKKTKTKEKKLKNLQIKQVKRESHKKRRRGVRNAASITLSTEEIEAKIEEIKSREVLSKRAKKILSVLNRKLRFEKSALDKSEKLNVIGKKGNKKNQQGTFVKTESVSNKDKKDKIKIKKEHVEHETIKLKQEKDDQNDSNIMKTEEDEDESDENQSDTETEESMQDANEELDDESEDEEDEDTEDDEEDEDDETDENDEDEEANTSKVKKEDEKKQKTQAKQSLEHQKKNRYVLFVGNLPTE